jgi:pimeloyl-ACP methyl ester carboxylesterase
MPYFENDGARLYYRAQGKQTAKGPVLLFIHGWCSNASHWHEQLKYFGKQHSVLSLDRRGLGRSSTPGTGHTPEQHVKDITALLKLLGIRKAIAIGHAGGGPVTLELTRTKPNIVKASVMIDSGLYPYVNLKTRNTPFAQILGSMVDSLSGAKGKQAFKTMYQGFFGPKCAKPIAKNAVADATKTPMATVIAEVDVMAVNTERMARDIKQPVLWLTANAVDQNYISKHLANVQFAQVVGSGHFPQMEVPNQTNAAIETFLSQLK